MEKYVLIVLVVLGILSVINAQDRGGRRDRGRCPRPTGVGICITNCSPRGRRCPRGEMCCRNACGGYVCTRRPDSGSGVPHWCPRGSPRLRCLVNPCQFGTCPRFPRARCRNDDPCEPACVGNFYNGRRRISRERCNSRG